MNKLIQIASGLLLLALLSAGVAARDEGLLTVPPMLVTAPVVAAKISEVEANLDLPGEAKSKLIALYRKVLSNLQEVETNLGQADAFEALVRTAPEQTQRLRERMAAATRGDTPDAMGVDPDVPLDRIESQLKQAQADWAAADAGRAELGRQLTYQQNRAAAIRRRLTAAQEEQAAIAAALQSEFAGDRGVVGSALGAGSGSDPSPAPSSSQMQAQRWDLETRYVALDTEMRALDQEMIALPMRLDLIAAKRDAESAGNVQMAQRVEGLRALVNARRAGEARQAQAEAARMVQATAHLDPSVAGLAGQNAAFIAELTTIAQQADGLDAEQQQAEQRTARTQASFERMQTAKAIGMPTEGLGALLLEHRAALPDFNQYAGRARDLEQQIAAVNLSRLRHQEARERLADPPTAGAHPAVGAQPGAAASPDLKDELEKQHQVLLAKLLEAEGRHLERLRVLRTTEDRMLEVAGAYEAFLNEQLFWLPTGARTRLANLVKLPDEVRTLLSPDRWSELTPTLRGAVAASPALWLSLLLAALLAWKRRALIAAIQGAAVPLANPSTDGFRYTLQALLWSLALAVPLPLVLGTIGWRLMDSAQAGGLPLIFGGYLVRVALYLYVLLLLRAICLPGGLAIGHFRWAESEVRRFDRELRWLTWTVVPAFLVLYIAMGLSPAATGGPVTRIADFIVAAAMGIFFYRFLHPKHGVLRRRRQGADAGLLHRACWLWFPLLLAFPMLLVALAWRGYLYATHIIADAFIITLGLIAALMLLYALAVRWVTLAHRRLALRAARQRRQTALAAREQGPSPATDNANLTPDDAADLDLEAASADSLELLRTVMVFVAVLGLYLIWSAVFPALGILQEVILWHSTAILDGEARLRPITLADLCLALVYLSAAAVLARRLPALLNMILAQRSRVTAGSRYAITTLTTYAIVAIGTVLALNAIGAQWSQLQWLVAALGVGIGFGLQEIVANFVSGLIILFERPIRVGDVVTLGDTDGVVTRIRIRATTIRNSDGKDLLVPNKEFITGRLLNWTLSDQVLRVMVTVGVAYGTDVEQAHALMREAAQQHARVLKDPPPILSFEGFGDNSLTLILRAFIDDLDYRLATITDLHRAIYQKFRQAGISIAFPQRDLHLDTREPLRVSLEAATPATPEGGDPRPVSQDA